MWFRNELSSLAEVPLLLSLLLLFLLVLLLTVWLAILKITDCGAVKRVTPQTPKPSHSLAAPSQKPRNAHNQRNGPRVTLDIQGGDQFRRSVLYNYFSHIWRQWHPEHAHRGVLWHFPRAKISAKRIFQLASPAEKHWERWDAQKQRINWCVLYLSFN